jgi:predicted Na+-dependent transporter
LQKINRFMGRGIMKKGLCIHLHSARTVIPLLMAVFLFGFISTALAGEEIYRELTRISQGQGDTRLFARINNAAETLDWSGAEPIGFKGNLRLLRMEDAKSPDDQIYMVRDISGELHLLAPPPAQAPDHTRANYIDLENKLGDKFTFNLLRVDGEVEGQAYSFVYLAEPPMRSTLDRVFKISIVLMLFFVMVGMGLTLTVADFRRVFTKPKAIITGAFLQWVIMPLVAVALGRMLGFYTAFPFIFVGFVLITVSPGGVTSNLMTFYARGDLALSISLTSFSTVLSIFFTPFCLALYCANVPEINIPVKLIVQTIIILVLIPLVVGMTVQAKATNFAKKATPVFAALGIIALLFLIIAGVLSNLEVFTETERYSVKFYSGVFTLTLLGMIVGIVFPKLLKINNYQVRALSLETGLRNASLAMALALLIQDYMGDFYSSMFVTSAIFGLLMYVAGFISIWVYKKVLPLEADTPEMEVNVLPESA